MGKYQIIIKATAEKDLSKHKKSGDLASIKKIIKILNELKDHPHPGSGNPEQIKFELSGFGREYLALKKAGYVYIDGKMVK